MTLSYEQNFGKSYNQMLPTLGKTLIEVIKYFDGLRLYGVGGDFAANLIKALGEGLEVCPSSNEMHAGFSACAQAEVDGMGFCLTTYTVGSLPCISAAALAMAESLPVIFISGAPGESEINKDAIHHTVHPNSSWKPEYDNALQAFQSMGMRAERLQGQRTPGQPNIAGERFYQLVNHAYINKQPVFIEIPRDLVFSKTQPLLLPTDNNWNSYRNNILSGSQHVAETIIQRLNTARAPLIYIGDGVKHNQRLKSLLVQFCHKFEIPFATTWFGKSLFNEFDPLCLGSYNGIFSDHHSRSYVETKMDYVLDIATSVLPRDANNAFSTGTNLIQNFENKTVIKGIAKLETDLIDILNILIDADIPTFSGLPVQSDNRYSKEDQHLDFHNLTKVLNELQENDDTPYVYIPEVGNSYFCSYSLKTRQSSLGKGWYTNPWYGAMGTSMPYARAIAKRIQDKGDQDRAVVLTGDGGFHFQLNELIHFMKDKTAVTIIYMRNNVFHLGKSGDDPIYHCNDIDFDVHSLIKAYGGESKQCTFVGQFKDYFSHCIKENSGIKLIEVPANPTEENQCREIRLLNLYIKTQNGDTEAQTQWKQTTSLTRE